MKVNCIVNRWFTADIKQALQDKGVEITLVQAHDIIDVLNDVEVILSPSVFHQKALELRYTDVPLTARDRIILGENIKDNPLIGGIRELEDLAVGIVAQGLRGRMLCDFWSIGDIRDVLGVTEAEAEGLFQKAGEQYLSETACGLNIDLFNSLR